VDGLIMDIPSRGLEMEWHENDGVTGIIGCVVCSIFANQYSDILTD